MGRVYAHICVFIYGQIIFTIQKPDWDTMILRMKSDYEDLFDMPNSKIHSQVQMYISL